MSIKFSGIPNQSDGQKAERFQRVKGEAESGRRTRTRHMMLSIQSGKLSKCTLVTENLTEEKKNALAAPNTIPRTRKLMRTVEDKPFNRPTVIDYVLGQATAILLQAEI